MKVCKYCGTESRDTAHSCESCGSKEFDFKCENCGKVFDSEFCPSCGVRAGEKAKKCPNCGKKYFSNACPDCGYVAQSGQAVYNTYQNNYYPPKKRRTWLWVLGWIFIFPVPLTIIILRQDKLNTTLKVALIIVSWLVFFGFAFMGNSDNETVEQAQGGPVTVSGQTVEETEPPTQEIETETESETITEEPETSTEYE